MTKTEQKTIKKWNKNNRYSKEKKKSKKGYKEKIIKMNIPQRMKERNAQEGKNREKFQEWGEYVLKEREKK